LQAQAAAEAIAAAAGADLDPTPFRPVLRSVLMTAGGPRALPPLEEPNGHAEPASNGAQGWPPAGKIAAPLLGPYLASRLAAHAG
jgi:hypothetical protein